MSNSILFRAPAGFAGDVTRELQTRSEPRFLNSSKPVLAYGAPVKLVSGKAEPFEANDTAANFYGVLRRVVPSQGNSLSQSFTDNVPNPDQVQDVITAGYINVVCAVGTPAAMSPAYIRVVADTGKAVGDFEATSDVSVAGVAGGGNTGTGTIGTLSATQSAQAGAYTVTMTGATAFTFKGPNGDLYATGATGSAYTADGVTFTITVGGTAFVSGDTFTVTVTKKNVLVSDLVWATDGKDTSNGNIAELRIAK